MKDALQPAQLLDGRVGIGAVQGGQDVLPVPLLAKCSHLLQVVRWIVAHNDVRSDVGKVCHVV